MTLVASLGLVLALPTAAQPTSTLYTAARGAGASPSDAAALSDAMRFVAPVQETKIVPADGAAGQYFGAAVSLSGDRALIGADGNAGTNAGSAYVFVRSGGIWTQEAKLTADDAAAGDFFGTSVSLLGDRALVGASLDDDRGTDSGSVYVFSRADGMWTQEAKLTATDGAASNLFGRSVSLSDDRALVGATGNDDVGNARGSAYVFVRSEGTWAQEAKLTADGAAIDIFGSFGGSVSLSDDRALIGSVQDIHEGTRSGAAYVFVRSGNTWAQEAKLLAVDRAEFDRFGQSVSLSGDHALVGVEWDDDSGTNSGSVYVFVRSGGTWAQEAKLTAADGAENDRFGNSVSLSGDRALIGAYLDNDGGIQSGSAYVFVRSGGTWAQTVKLLSTDRTAFDYFGGEVSLSGDQALVGASDDDDAGLQSGAAYVFADIGGVVTEGDAPVGVTLSAPVPNPSAGRAVLTLTVERAQTVRAVVLDALGREVAAAFEGVVTATADIAVATAGLPVGVYAVRVTGETFVQTRRLTVVR